MRMLDYESLFSGKMSRLTRESGVDRISLQTEFQTRDKCELYKMNDPNSHGSERALADILT